MFGCYRKSDILFFLQWDYAENLWKHHTPASKSVLQGLSRTYKAFDSTYVTLGEICREWPLLEQTYEIERICSRALGVSTEFVFEHIPYESIQHFDREHYSEQETTGEMAKMAELPNHIREIVLDYAEQRKQTCPISFKLLTKKNGHVTTCGHIFDKHTLQTWCVSHSTCPECRASIR